MAAKVISVANIKGGVSKTSTGIFLATALAHDDRKVLYLDCDSQESATEFRTFEKQTDYAETPEPYRIRKTDPTFLYDLIEDMKANHDVIFVDLPRLTHGKEDKTIAMILALCDYILIPIKSGELDNMSTARFVEIIKKIADHKKERGIDYLYAGFGSMTGKRPSDDKAAKEFMETLEIPILENDMKDLKEFSRSYTFESLLNIGKAEKQRFEPFYKEVVTFFNL